MKVLGIIIFLFAALLIECGKSESNARANTNENVPDNVSVKSEPAASNTPVTNLKNMDEVFRSAGKKGEIEFQLVGKRQNKGKYDGINYPNDNLIIEYTVKNTGAKDFILYNQGHSDSPNRQIVYVEPQPDGSIELAQKAFAEPKNCPLRDAPITPRTGSLKAGETVSGKVFIELPLKQKTPFDDCVPPAEMPPKTNKIKFCLGIQEAGDSKPNIGKQEFLCSDSFELK